MDEPKTTSVSSAAVKTDRISSLPDDIIHQIIAGVDRSIFANPFKLSILSKRWNQILLSYPFLIVNDYPLKHKQPQQRITAVKSLKKFLRRRISNSATFPTESVTIHTNLWQRDFVDDVLELTAKISPREIHFHVLSYEETYTIPQCVLSSEQFFRRLTVLKLDDCTFPDGICLEGLGLGISLKVLRLDSVRFPGDGFLDTMIACASRLETLEVYGIDRRFQVANHPNLKSVSADDCEEFEIIGVGYLEKLEISDIAPSCFRVSSTPNLKLLYIRSEDFKYEDLMKLISEFPSLESIRYDDCQHEFNFLNTRREIKFLWWHSYHIDVEIDASRVVDDFVTCFLTILCKLDRGPIELVPLLAELSQFQVTVCITSTNINHILENHTATAPAIEHLKISSLLVNRQACTNLVHRALHTCHPKLMSFTIPKYGRTKTDDLLVFQLKDVKLVTRFTNGDIKEDEVIDVLGDTLVSSLVEGDEVRFHLTWH